MIYSFTTLSPQPASAALPTLRFYPAFYPIYLRERFTNRAHELAFLERVA